jgi:hypothetical protein
MDTWSPYTVKYDAANVDRQWRAATNNPNLANAVAIRARLHGSGAGAGASVSVKS